MRSLLSFMNRLPRHELRRRAETSPLLKKGEERAVMLGHAHQKTGSAKPMVLARGRPSQKKHHLRLGR
ncbi:protein of unknown function [Candidatus Filomicrobium marinum]|uniref:Uncharacterized protein n=1 Tax=Candidatus Filomicrobium marinum TaxID=1608628 RepID=A0A0D6J9M4_9HYPH|nr:protein of unknown function [Candidatus Filomicrobium marinum]